MENLLVKYANIEVMSQRLVSRYYLVLIESYLDEQDQMTTLDNTYWEYKYNYSVGAWGNRLDTFLVVGRAGLFFVLLELIQKKKGYLLVIQEIMLYILIWLSTTIHQHLYMWILRKFLSSVQKDTHQSISFFIYLH